MEELAESGFKYNADEVLFITKNSDGKLLWLEKGSDSAGLQHILKEHESQFVEKGIPTEQVPDFLSNALTEGSVVGMQNTRPIYEIMYNGKLQRVAITVSDNGFIVGANPVSIH